MAISEEMVFSLDLFSYKFCIAEVIIEIQTDLLLKVPEDFLPFYIVNETPSDYKVNFYLDSELSVKEGILVAKDYDNEVFRFSDGTYKRFYHNPGSHKFYGVSSCDSSGQTSVSYLEIGKKEIQRVHQCFRMSGWEQAMNVHERLLLHASLVETTQGGILFAGPSGIGKSTQARLWEQFRGSKQINGDRPILHKENVWFAYGSPLAGSSRCCINEKTELKAIFLLGQAEECSIKRVSMNDAYKSLYALSTVYSWSIDYVERTLKMIQQLITDIPVYQLDCTPDERAIEIVEEQLREDSVNE